MFFFYPSYTNIQIPSALILKVKREISLLNAEMAIVYAFQSPVLIEPKACLWKAADGHWLLPAGLRRVAACEVQDTLGGNEVTTAWMDVYNAKYQFSFWLFPDSLNDLQ